MSTSQRTFDQVRSILGKLDRDIDAARSKRLQARMPQTAPVTTPVLNSPTPPRPVSPTGTAGYGRATPMRLDQRSNPSH